MIKVVRRPYEMAAALAADLFNDKKEVSLKTNSTACVKQTLASATPSRHRSISNKNGFTTTSQ